MSYKVLSQHGEAARTRSRRFDTADEAEAYAKTISPEIDGSTVPQLRSPMLDKAIRNDTYVQGFFWFGNRYAVTIDA